MSANLILLERILADAMCAADPLVVIDKACADVHLPESVRTQLAGVDADGLRIAALLVVRLRFERVIAGSTQARASFERNPAAFAQRFKLYHTSEAPIHLMPAAEGTAFDNWNLVHESPGE